MQNLIESGCNYYKYWAVLCNKKYILFSTISNSWHKIQFLACYAKICSLPISFKRSIKKLLKQCLNLLKTSVPGGAIQSYKINTRNLKPKNNI